MANPNDISDIINVEVTISNGGGVSIQSFSEPIFVSEFSANASFLGRVKGYAGTLPEMQAALVADGFSTTSAPYRQITAAGLQQGPPDLIYIGRKDPLDVTYTAALTEIWDEGSDNDLSFYFLAVDERDTADIEEIADFSQARGFVLYMGQTASSSVYNNDPGNVAANIIAKGYDSTALVWHAPEVASNFAPAKLVGRTGPFALPAISGDLQLRIDGGGLQPFTLVANAATQTGTNTGTFSIANLDPFEVTVDGGVLQTLIASLIAATVLSDNAETYDITPGWKLSVRVDGGAAADATFAGVAGSVATGAATFVLANLETVTFDIDGTGNQVVTFNAGDFANIALATAAELNAVYTTQLTGVTVTDDGSIVTVVSSTFGSGSDVEIVAGTGGALAALTYGVGNNAGSGDAVNLAAMTAVEAALVIDTDIAGATSAADTGSIRVTSGTLGKASKLQIVGGNANAAFGFNTNEFSGSGDFNDSTAVLTSEVVTWLSDNLFGLTVGNSANAVQLTTKTRGSDSSIQITASTIATTLGLAVGTIASVGSDVANAATAFASEIATKISATIVSGTAGSASSAIIITSLVTGPTSSVEIVGGSYAALLFSDTLARGTGTDEDYIDCAYLGRLATLPLDSANGQSTWDNAPLIGVLPDKIPASIRAVLHKTLKVNTFERRAGRNEMHFGTVLFGNLDTFRYIDHRVTADWGDARSTETFKSTLNLLADAKSKAPGTDDGIQLLANDWIALLKRGETNGHWIFDDSAITGFNDTGIKIPTIAEQTEANRGLRKVAGFQARFDFLDAIQRADAKLDLKVNIPS